MFTSIQESGIYPSGNFFLVLDLISISNFDAITIDDLKAEVKRLRSEIQAYQKEADDLKDFHKQKVQKIKELQKQTNETLKTLRQMKQ